MTNALAQRIENIMREIDDISHPPTKTIPISEVEEEISKYKDNTLSIDIQDNTTEAWELKNRSDYWSHRTGTLAKVKEGKSPQLTKIIEDLRIPKSTLVTFIPKESEKREQRIKSLFRELEEICPLNIAFNTMPTQTHTTIRIKDPIISILSDFKKMCERRLKVMLETIQHETHPRSKKEAIEIAITTIFRNWDKQGGYHHAIAKVKETKKKNIKCKLLETLKEKLRNPAEHERHNLTTDDVKNLVGKVQKLTPKDITEINTK